MDLNKLNCMNYQVHNHDGDYWFAYNGLRSLYRYAKCSDTSLRTIAEVLLDDGQIVIKDMRENDNETLCITMI